MVGSDTTGNGTLGNPYATIQRAIDSFVGIQVDNTDTLAVGATLSIDGSIFKISLITDGQNMTVENLGYAVNVPPTTTINFPAFITFFGEQGEKGDTGDDGELIIDILCSIDKS